VSSLKKEQAKHNHYISHLEAAAWRPACASWLANWDTHNCRVGVAWREAEDFKDTSPQESRLCQYHCSGNSLFERVTKLPVFGGKALKNVTVRIPYILGPILKASQHTALCINEPCRLSLEFIMCAFSFLVLNSTGRSEAGGKSA